MSVDVWKRGMDGDERCLPGLHLFVVQGQSGRQMLDDSEGVGLCRDGGGGWWVHRGVHAAGVQVVRVLATYRGAVFGTTVMPTLKFEEG